MINLPPVEKGAAAFDADYYGAATLIARKLGLKETPFTSADWLHGWAADNILDTKWISPNSGLERTILTNKESITKYFISNSYKNTYTVGLPFLYAPVMAGTSRIPDSLLIMPPHVTTHSKSRDYDNLKAFFLDIKKYSKNYSKISVCISGSCFENEQYVNFIKDKGFDIIFGAWIFDRNALIRMKTILSSFTTIISNSVGSHLAYAAYCGTRVIMASPLDKPDFDKLAKSEPQFIRFPHLIPILKKEIIENTPEKKFPFLFEDNQDLEQLKKWADNELGAAFMKDPDFIANLFGWFSIKVNILSEIAKPVPLLPKTWALPKKHRFC